VHDGVSGFLCIEEADMVARLREVDHVDRRACRDRVARSFSLQRMVADHHELYDALLDEQAMAAQRNATEG
jgi:hypothetical protein